MIKQLLSTAGCLFLLNAIAQLKSGYPTLQVGKNYLLKYHHPSLPLVEPHLAINPANGKHMVAAAIVFDSAQTSETRTHIAVFATKDGGKSWKHSDLPMTVGFDPWVAIKNDKQVALVALAGYQPGYRNGLVYYSSKDGGFTWSATDTVMFGGGHDHATMIVNFFNRRLYLLSSFTKRDSAKQMHTYAWLNYSEDWKTFQTPSLFHVGAVNSNTLTVNVLPDGTVVLPYVEYAVNDNQPGSPLFKYVYSRDGKHFSKPFIITDKAGLAKGFAVSAADVNSVYKGRIYFVKNTGSIRDRSNGLYLQYADGAEGKWSDEVRIDHNEAPDKFIRTAAIAVNKDGVVGIAWVDRRNDSELKKNDIYFSVSIDGGKSFENEVRVTNVNSDPATANNGKAGERFISGGDYMGCVAKPDGSFQLLWADSRSGIFQLYTSNVKIIKRK